MPCIQWCTECETRTIRPNQSNKHFICWKILRVCVWHNINSSHAIFYEFVFVTWLYSCLPLNQIMRMCACVIFTQTARLQLFQLLIRLSKVFFVFSQIDIRKTAYEICVHLEFDQRPIAENYISRKMMKLCWIAIPINIHAF